MSVQKRAYVPVSADVGPVDYPVINLPLSAFDNGAAVVHTSEGDVAISAIYHRYYCRGSSEALIAMGLIAASWLPGQPGNNKTRQTILFDEGGRRCLVVGRAESKSERLKLDIRCAGREYCVQIAMSDAQRKGHEVQRAEQAAAEEKARLHAATQQREPMTPMQAKRSLQYGAEGCLRSLKLWQKDTGCAFTDESTHRIHAAFEALRNAYAGASMVRMTPRYRREGNVIYWPARS